MKNYSLIVALLVLLVASVSFAETQPVTEDAALVEAGEVEIDTTPRDVEVEPAKYYSPWLAGFGNLIPGLGYFLIDEPGWAWAELGVLVGGVVGGTALIIAATPFCITNDPPNAGQIIGEVILLTGISAYLGGIIYAPLLAMHKNEQQRVALDLSPGLGLDSEGEVYPTVQLTLSL